MPVNPPRFFECPAPKHLERPALVAKSGKPLKRVLTGFTGGCGRSCSGMCCPLCGKTGIRLVAFIDAAGVHMIGGQWRANPKKTRSISYRIGSGCGDSPLDFSYWRDTGTNMFPDRTTNQEAINEKEYKRITHRIGTAAQRPICQCLLVQHPRGNTFERLGSSCKFGRPSAKS